MSDQIKDLAKTIKTAHARIGETEAFYAYLGRSPSDPVLVPNSLIREVFWYRDTGNGWDWGTAVLAMEVPIPYEEIDNYHNVRVKIGKPPGNATWTVLKIDQHEGYSALGNESPLGQKVNAAGFPTGVNFADFRCGPQSPATTEAQVQPGEYLDTTAAIKFFAGDNTGNAATSAATCIAALTSGQHQVCWLCFNVTTGLLDTVVGTAQTATGSLPSRAEFYQDSDFNSITAASPLKRLIPVYLYFGQDAAGVGLVEADFYRTRDARWPLASDEMGTVQATTSASGTVANTTSETSVVGTVVGSATLAANALAVGRTLRIQAWGIVSDTGTPTLTLKIKLGSTIILTTGAITLANTISNKLWRLEAVITCRSTGASGSIFGQGQFNYNNGAFTDIANTAATTIDTTASQVVDVTATWGTANASNTISGINCIIEVLN